MVRHSNLYHRGREVNFRMSVVSLHKDPVSRLCREDVDIVAGNQDILLNSKEEFFQGAVPRTRTQRGFGFLTYCTEGKSGRCSPKRTPLHFYNS